ncbi:MAG: hypothetical protein KC493_02735 [Bacteriovoracaceae bacterium]|nr:hypothetical protein [Bacteriovoracaceae bacterium]
MKETYLNDSASQKEALINEFKGNLFEYLVGHQLARSLQIESKFIQSFGGELRTRLSEYESWIRVHDNDLILELPKLASETANNLLGKLESKKIENVLVMGKSGSAGGNDNFKEADILLLMKDKSVKPVSLKLCKANSFVNTKSAGVKSFISKYFSSFNESSQFQKELNDLLTLCYTDMASQLHSMASLPFNGGFDQSWTQAGLTELPGQLEPHMNEVVIKSYRPVISKIREILLILQESDSELFIKSLRPLIGIGKEEMLQATCYHSVVKGKKYQFHSFDYFDSFLLDKEVRDITIGEQRPEVSSFEIKLGELLLQIRVKPMNKFTSEAYKINCSIKKH